MNDPLSIALAAPVETGLQVGRTRHQPGSISSSVAALGIGESFFYNAQVPQDTPLSTLQAVMTEAKAKCRKNAGGIVDKTAKLTGNTYTTTSDEFLAADGAVFIFVRITRVS